LHAFFTLVVSPFSCSFSQVNPVTHAVGNTIKRVVIIVASVIAFKTPMSKGSIIGSSVAIAGTLLYSLAMNASKSKKDSKKT
jgi:solute carrier family 35 protein E1